MDPKKILGSRMKYIRKARGYSVEYFAGYLGVSPATLRRYEAGETEPDAEIIARLTKLLGISADDFLGSPEAEWINMFPDGEKLPEDEIKKVKMNYLKELE